MKTGYDFIVCGAGSSGCVVARRLAENPAVNVLLLEAGGTDALDAIMDPGAWRSLRQCAQNWMYRAAPTPNLNGRTIPMAMGKVLGGGSSINVMLWSRGHRSDWEHFAKEAGDDGWNYRAVLDIYQRVENWLGTPDADRRGRNGPLIVQPAPDPHPLAPAMVEAFAAAGIPRFEDQNGVMMEGDGGAAIANLCVWGGRRQSIYRAYVHPYVDRPNLTVLSGATVLRLIIDGARAEGVEFRHQGEVHGVRADTEVVLSLGALHTPKALMLSGIGDRADLQRFDIPVVQHLPGVGRNFQDHCMAPCVFESTGPIAGRNNLGEATALWMSKAADEAPDFQAIMVEAAYASPEAAPAALPPHAWSVTAALLHPKSRGAVRLTSADPEAPVEIDANFLGDPEDVAKLKECVDFVRMIGHAPALRPFMKRELLPGSGHDEALGRFLRNGTVSHSHQSCSAKMGRDAMSVVDGNLRVYGIDRLRVADASIMPRLTTGNTMAPSVVIGERAAEILKAAHRI